MSERSEITTGGVFPIFYFVIAMYNAEKTIEACLASIARQSCRQYRVVIVNDGSTDGSLAICERIRDNADPRIHIITTKNCGAFSARVTGMKYVAETAQEDAYTWFVDADDTISENALEVLHNALTRMPCDIAAFNYNSVQCDTRRVEAIHDHSETGRIDDAGRIARRVVLGSFTGVLWRYVYSNKLIKAAAAFAYEPILREKLRLCEDVLFNTILLGACETALFLKERLYNYADIKKRNGIDKLRDSFRAFEHVEGIMLERGIWNEADWKAYNAEMAKWAMWCVDGEICFLRKPLSEKADALKKLSQSDYFMRIMKERGGLAGTLLTGGRCRTAACVETLHGIARDAKKRIKR